MRMLRKKAPRVVKSGALPRKTPVDYFIQETKQVKWRKCFVNQALEHYVVVRTSARGTGRKIRIAYEDVSLASTPSLFYELERLELDLGKDLPEDSAVDPRVSENKLQFAPP